MSMKTRFTALAALLGAALLPGALPAPAAAAEDSPWWQLLSGSRPTNLQPAPDQSETQEVTSATADLELPFLGSIGEGVLVAPISLGGEAIGCLGAGEFVGLGVGFFTSPAAVCEEQTGFPAAQTVETPAELAELLEGLYGHEVTLAGPEGQGEAPAGFGEGAFTVITPDRWVTAPLGFGPPVAVENPIAPPPTLTLGGSASSEVTSEGSGILTLTLTDLGTAPVVATEEDPLTIRDSLPPGAQAYAARAIAGTAGEAGTVECAVEEAERSTREGPVEVSLLECSFEGELPAYEAIEVEILVALKEGAGERAGGVSVWGANAPEVRRRQELHLSSAPVDFGLEHFSVRAEAKGGLEAGEATQGSPEGAAEADEAGSHPFQLTTTIVANTGPQSGPTRLDSTVIQPALPRNLRFTLPAGLIGNATAVPTCEMAVFLDNRQLVNRCPAEAAIGATSVTIVEPLNLKLTRIAVPVFNLPPGRGEPARFGFLVAGDPVVIDTAVDPENSYRISAEVRNITQVPQFLAATTTIWGAPGAGVHDSQRGWKCVYHRGGVEGLPGSCPDEPTPNERRDTPLLRLPVSCAAPQPFEAAFEPWNVPIGSQVFRALSQSPAPRACNQIPFAPDLTEASATSKLADIEQLNRPLYRAYLLKEQLRQIYRLGPRAAVRLLDDWLLWARRCRLKPFVKLARTITAQREGIIAGILRAHADGPLSRAELEQRLGWAAEASLRAATAELCAQGALEREGRRPIVTRLTPGGRDLLRLADSLERWHSRAPFKISDLDDPVARGIIRTLLAGWESTIVHALAERPRRLSELKGETPGQSYSALKRCFARMRAAGLVESLDGTVRSPAYEATAKLRRAAGPLSIAIRWDLDHSPDTQVGILDLEAILLLVLPLIRLPRVSGSCLLAMAEPQPAGDNSPAAVRIAVKEGQIVDASLDVGETSDTWAVASPKGWLEAAVDGSHSAVRTWGPDARLAKAVVGGIHRTLFL